LFQFGLICFKIVCFCCFASILKQRVSMFRLNQNKQMTKQNSLIERIFWYFSENLGLLRYVLVCFETVLFCFGCFYIGSKHQNKPKQAKICAGCAVQETSQCISLGTACPGASLLYCAGYLTMYILGYSLSWRLTIVLCRIPDDVHPWVLPALAPHCCTVQET
jgi:hypothetical protein